MPEQLRILVIEDNAADVLLIQEALNARGFNAKLQVISNGEHAQKALAAIDSDVLPDLIILDLNLPRISGMTLLKSIRSMPRFQASAVMVLTSSQAPKDRLEAERLGADEFVSKPLTLDDFLQTVGAGIQRAVSKRPRAQFKRGSAARLSRSARRREFRRYSRRLTGLVRAARRAVFSNNFR